MIFIYKELIKKYLSFLTVDHIKNYALTQNEALTDQEATIIYNYILKYQNELLNKNTTSFTILRQNIRKDLFDKIVLLYNEYSQKYL